ncbi:MAG: cupin domain-containing protein [Myxococcota bacterium]
MSGDNAEGSAARAACSPEAQAMIDRLRLAPHPEGGFFREVWRSPVEFPQSSLPEGYPGPRVALTSIYYLLPTGGRSELHRVRGEEVWMHHQGDDLVLGIGETQVEAANPVHAVRLGQGERAALQRVVPPGHWQQAEAKPGPFGFALVGCVVAPGFDFEDFEMA